MTGTVGTSLHSAKSIYEADASFVIPSYQRPYVWPSDEALRLLDDILGALREDASHYFIGTVMSSLRTGDGELTYEVIDGQQRITTLILFALAFNKVSPHTRLAQLAVRGKTLRLNFAIRDQVQSLLGHWAGIDDAIYPGDKAVEEDPYLKHLAGALKALSDRLNEIKKNNIELEPFGDFIFERVRWVNNVMPSGSDLNRQFTTMNTSGLQLAQSDILKSRLLKKITKHKARYDAIWQACENMGNYFERNVRQLFPLAGWSTMRNNDLRQFDSARFPLEEAANTDNSDYLTIAQLVNDDPKPVNTAPSSATAKTEEESVYCRSVISFALLLMHTLRIFHSRRGHTDIDVRLHDGRLIECFDEFSKKSSESEVTDFLTCLWEVRFHFDRWVVKWAGSDESEERHLLLAPVYMNTTEGRLTRSLQDITNLTQLQSVSYFTRESSAQYWLTPFLGKLLEAPLERREDAEALLEGIDNKLSLTRLTQKNASYAILQGAPLELNDFVGVRIELSSARGTGFERYWFQKLEYVLWRQREKVQCFEPEKLRSYRITSKNSIEHVHPQNEEHERSLPDELLHSFGNLVLLSPGENSSYSNHAVLKKWASFHAKPKYDALKLAHIFYTRGLGEWDREAIGRHQTAMLNLLQSHYANPNAVL